MPVTIIGAGNMGRAIGTRMLAAGESVTLIDRDQSEAEQLARDLNAGAKNGARVTVAPRGAPIEDDLVYFGRLRAQHSRRPQ